MHLVVGLPSNFETIFSFVKHMDSSSRSISTWKKKTTKNKKTNANTTEILTLDSGHLNATITSLSRKHVKKRLYRKYIRTKTGES